MAWFDEQIRQRKLNDDELLAQTYGNLAGAILGHKVVSSLSGQPELAKDAIDAVLRFYRVKSVELPAGMDDLHEQLEYLMRPYGIMRRTVRLKKGWTGDATGAMLGTRSDDGSVVALIPRRLGGYSFYDVKQGRTVRLSRRNEHLIDDEAMAFYKPFPLRKITVADLIMYINSIRSSSDMVFLVVMTALVTGVGMLIPWLINILTGEVVDTSSIGMLGSAAVFLICVVIAQNMLTSVRSLILTRIKTRVEISVQAATMMRILSLPADFFGNYSSGELSTYMSYVDQLCSMLVETVVSMGLTSLFSLAYILQIFAFAPALVAPALIVILVTMVFAFLSAIVNMRYSKQLMTQSAKESGLSFALLSGIQKIKLSGAEKRAFAKWGKEYSKEAELNYNPPAIIRYSTVINLTISLTGTLIMYYIAAKSNVSVQDYFAFSTAYAMVTAGFMALVMVATTFTRIRPVIEMVKPIMDTEPEISEGKQMVTRLSGNIELSHVSFRYNESMPFVLDDISLKIKAGQYVAIVGRTGCGKSTLMRLLLGFETPQKGGIMYDNKDIRRLDLKSLRRRIGVVMQNGKLFQGDIFSNIVIAAPWLTLDDAWEAAELSGIADDIRDMPMGMNTVIAEGAGGISGGQKQRLMIARAIAPKPKILMLDEATSALDNITQKMVSDSLNALKCTRIVIAHRLSTIKQCDRIIVLDGGHIVEDGKYDELIAAGGFFAELVRRQQVDAGEV